MHPLMEKIALEKPVVTDGSWGTQMIVRGLGRGESPDSWNLVHPDLVEDVARGYVEAGSRIILTNTFGANRIVLEKFGLADKAVQINERGVEISKKAAGDAAYVFASIGPSGKILMMGEITEDRLREVYEEQAQALARAGADGVVVETMSDLGEIKIAAAAALATGLPVVASMVYDSGRNKDRTMMGHSPEEAARALAGLGVDAVGANCGQGIEGFLPVCKALRASTDLPVWIKPNAGQPEIVDGKTVYLTPPGEFTAYVPALIEAGADFIGGCCGTNPDFVAEIRKVLRRG